MHAQHIFTHRVFQSTLPRRERPFLSSSILRSRANFNPRSREGSDVIGKTIFDAAKVFQSTLP